AFLLSLPPQKESLFMARALRSSPAERALVLLAGIVVGFAVIAVLYWAQRVLIPVALAIFFTFLLVPVVTKFQRWGLPRVPAVLAATLLTSIFVLALRLVMVSKAVNLVNDMPNYSDTIKKKVETVQSVGESIGWERFDKLMQDLGLGSTNGESSAARRRVGGTTVVPVVVEKGNPWLNQLPAYV